MTVAAIVVTYRTGPRLRDCLYGLRADPDVDEILIVDNGNDKREAAFITRFVASTPRAKHIVTGANLGFGKAANIGAHETAATYLLVINPDAMIRWKSIPAMLAAGENRAHPWI
ncbi:MAG: glycosyltransferase, partial [Pseudomonadota bacterium]